MKRRIFNFLSWTSLLACMSIVGLWLYAQHHCGCRVTIKWSEGRHHLTYSMTVMGWNAEEIYQFISGETYLFDPALPADVRERDAQVFKSICPPDRAAHFWTSTEPHFKLPYETFASGTEAYRSFSIAKLACAFALLPALRLVVELVLRRRRKFLERIGKCLNCGYDLRATPGRCPECGRGSERLSTKSSS